MNADEKKKQVKPTPRLRGPRPRRAGRRWMDQAPPYVLSCHDEGDASEVADRYTVLLWDPAMVDASGFAWVDCLGMSGAPTHPQGVSQFSQLKSSSDRLRKRVRWLDLPRHIRQHVISRWYDGDDDQAEKARADYALYTPGVS